MAITTNTGAKRRAWECRIGCCAALSLTILEIKRLLLLALEMLVDSRAIRFAGALLPIAFSFVDVGFGFPVAVAALFSMRKHQVRPCYPNKKQGLRRIASILTICVVLNIVTMVLIGCKVNLDVDSLRKAFKASMRLYARKVSYKLVVDELQLDLQCCGFSSYADWFSFDWQSYDYEDDSEDTEEYNEQSVPFSCCDKRTILPCLHAEMRNDEKAKTINNLGCSIALSRILFKITLVGYTMTGLIVCTQLLLIVFLIRIIRKVMPDICPSDCSCWEPSCPMTASIIKTSSDECLAQCHREQISRYRDPSYRHTCTRETIVKPRKICRRPRVTRKFCASTTSKCSTTRSVGTTSYSSDSSSSSCARLTSSPSLTSPRQNDRSSTTTTTNAHAKRMRAKPATRQLDKQARERL